MAEVTVRNGIDVDQLTATVRAVQENPGLAAFRFRARTPWEGGARSRTTVQDFYGAGQEDTSRTRPLELRGDEPPVLLGTNTAPDAVETVLSALASRLSVGFVYHGAARGITVHALDFELQGDLDLRGLLGLSDQVRPGFGDVWLTYRVRADAPREQLDALWEHVERTSPVLDVLRNPVPVRLTLAD
jgi:hypothetical protein